LGRYINIKNLSFSYGSNRDELKNINLSIRAGEVIVITGPSGSGKSTITRLVNGLVPRFYGGEIRGSLEIEGIDESNSVYYERGRLVGNVFQDPRSQFFSNEVAGEVAFGCENYGYSHEQIVTHVKQTAAEIGITDILENKVRTLSYGMRQKVAIASAEAMEPETYVMDEPSANLDIEATYQFSRIIGKLKEQGKTIIITEHRQYYLMNIADRFSVSGKWRTESNIYKR
jgi:energy-coupling factor transport system ATP-binding protein